VSGRKVGVIAALAAVAVGGALLIPHRLDTLSQPDAEGRNEFAANGNVQGVVYPGDPQREAVLVEAEANRLAYIRQVVSAAQWDPTVIFEPYRIPTADASTLVLPARTAAYTVDDLLALAPETFTVQAPGIYLLSENIVVLENATLSLTSTTGLDLRLASEPGGFTTITTLGGTLLIEGTEAEPVEVSSWNSDTFSPDRQTADGRAYLRADGGHVDLTHAQFADLGFWSGDTGGLSLTGTGTRTDLEPEAAPASPQSQAPVGAPFLPPTQLAPIVEKVARSDALVSAAIADITVTGNAYGLYMRSAHNVTVSGSTISRSLVDGVALHRSVTDAAISTTTSRENAVDGFSLARSSADVSFTGVNAAANGRNGISLDGRPLADGPSAVGTSVEAYGGLSVSGSTIVDNARYGIEISGGSGFEVLDNEIESNLVGIVLNHGARVVTITDNHLVDQGRQSIAVRDTVSQVAVVDNHISETETGVYVRNAGASVAENTMSGIGLHGVSLVGNARDVRVTGNSIAGDGSTAIWTDDAKGGTVERNDLHAWAPAPTVQSVTSWIFQPLTIIWILLGLLLVGTTLTRRGSQYDQRAPYEERVPLTELSRGIVSPESVRNEH
jgi:hypothetical protein